MRIYRGVSVSRDAENGGKLASRGTSDELEAECGDDNVQFGTTTLEFGRSPSNARYFHNVCSSTYRTSYLSFTSDEKVARWFATYENSEEGWIYVTDTELLAECGVEFFDDPGEVMNAEESEILVNLRDLAELPPRLIIDKYKVAPSA